MPNKCCQAITTLYVSVKPQQLPVRCGHFTANRDILYALLDYANLKIRVGKAGMEQSALLQYEWHFAQLSA